MYYWSARGKYRYSILLVFIYSFSVRKQYACCKLMFQFENFWKCVFNALRCIKLFTPAPEKPIFNFSVVENTTVPLWRKSVSEIVQITRNVKKIFSNNLNPEGLKYFTTPTYKLYWYLCTLRVPYTHRLYDHRLPTIDYIIQFAWIIFFWIIFLVTLILVIKCISYSVSITHEYI